jgi:hypothetical protein
MEKRVARQFTADVEEKPVEDAVENRLKAVREASWRRMGLRHVQIE